MGETVYKVIEPVGTSEGSWKGATGTVVPGGCCIVAPFRVGNPRSFSRTLPGGARREPEACSRWKQPHRGAPAGPVPLSEIQPVGDGKRRLAL